MSGEESGDRSTYYRSRGGRRGGRGGGVDRRGRQRRANNNDGDNDTVRSRGRDNQQKHQHPGTTRRNYRGGRGRGRINNNNMQMQMQQLQQGNPLLDVDSFPASIFTSSRSLQNNPLIDADSLLPEYSSGLVPSIVSTMTSRASSTITTTTDSDTTPRIASSSLDYHSFDRQNRFNANTKNNKIITILPWPHPFSHYIPKEDEERLLPTLIRWGKKERGMMKDQPEFRLRELQQRIMMLQQVQPQPQQRPCGTISLIQSLSLRRHHLKLLNPNLGMPELRLGSEDDINKAAALFEMSVSTYLRRHGVEFWTEKDQRRMHVRNNRYEKQPPTPDFRMKDGHAVVLDLDGDDDDDDVQNSNDISRDNTRNNFNHSSSSSSYDNTDNSKNNSYSPLPNVITIHWIDAKMFYGASTIPHDTPNAVGTILSKVKQYVSLYGHGALVFMYGCGDQLAKQLLDVGVFALDGRCLDLDEVVRHQRQWCSDARGNILF